MAEQGTEQKSKKITSGLAWSFAERISAQLVSTVVSIILARLLTPEHYGVISIVMIFISICNIFVTDGFGKVLVQRSDIQTADFDTMFWTSFGFSLVLYAILFFAAPYISLFYEMPILSPVIRVLGLRLILVSANSIQQAFVQRQMAFKKFFISTSFGTAISAVVGIVMAYAGYGVWALVAQYLVNTGISTVVLVFTCGWVPHLRFSARRLWAMLPFSLRVLAQSIVFTVEDNIRSLIVGKRFGSADLAYYNKGRQFPQLIITNLNTSIGKVMLPAVSREQEDLAEAKRVTRQAIALGMYILCPAMIGFCAVGETFVSVLLTDKWLPAVPFLQIFCIAYLARPFETTCSSSILALGRSDITLRNMIIVNVAALISVFVAVYAFDSVLLIAVGTLLSALISIALYSHDVKKHLHYSYREQLADCLPAVACSVVMAAAVWAMQFLPLPKLPILVLQVLVGGAIYIALSILFRIKQFDTLKRYLKKKR